MARSSGDWSSTSKAIDATLSAPVGACTSSNASTRSTLLMPGKDGAEAIPSPQQAARCRGLRLRSFKMPQDGGAGRRDAFAFQSIVEEFIALQQQCACWGGGRQHAMRGFGTPASERQCGHRPCRPRQRVDQSGGSNDVRDRIPATQFVKADLVGCGAVDLALDFGEQRKNRHRPMLHTRRRRAGEQILADAGKRRFVVLMMAAVRMRMPVYVLMRIVHRETQASERMVTMLDRSASTSGGRPAARIAASMGSRSSGNASSTAAMNISPATPPTASR